MTFAYTFSRAHLKEDEEVINEEEINAQMHMICSNAESNETTRKVQEMTKKRRCSTTTEDTRLK